MNISLSLGLPKLSMRKLDALCATQPTPSVTEGLGISTHQQDQPLITGKGLIGCKICCRVNPLENIAFTWRHHHYRSKGVQNFGLCSHSAYGFLAEGK